MLFASDNGHVITFEKQWNAQPKVDRMIAFPGHGARSLPVRDAGLAKTAERLTPLNGVRLLLCLCLTLNHICRTFHTGLDGIIQGKSKITPKVETCRPNPSLGSVRCLKYSGH